MDYAGLSLMGKQIINKHNVIVWGRYPSLNEFISANNQHRLKANKMKHESERTIIACVMAQLGKLKIQNKIFIKYDFYEPNKKRDLDNISGYFHKVFQDSLVTCGVIQNDNWHYVVGYQDNFYIDNKSPRIEVTICEVE